MFAVCFFVDKRGLLIRLRREWCRRMRFFTCDCGAIWDWGCEFLFLISGVCTEFCFEFFDGGMDSIAFFTYGVLDIWDGAQFLECIESHFEGSIIVEFFTGIYLFEAIWVIYDEAQELDRIGIGAFKTVCTHHRTYLFCVCSIELRAADLDELLVCEHGNV